MPEIEPDPADAYRQTPTELSLEGALRLALHLHRTGRLDDAETLYRRILDAAPEQPDALHFLGVLKHSRGDSTAAIDLIHRAIAAASGQPGFYLNLGNVLIEAGRPEEGADAYRMALALRPDNADIHNNLGTLLKAQGKFADARAAYEKAITLDPEHVDAYNNLGNLLARQGRTKEAVACYCKALVLIPDNPETKRLLGIAYYTLGDLPKAAEMYRQWLLIEPDHPVAKHMLAACSGEDVPPRASDDYIEKTFDVFAGSFDAKLGNLAYRAPQLVAQALAKAAGPPEKRLAAVDAGCGTGLCGPLVTGYVSRLVGVDLSQNMLEKARSRGAYDELVKAELTEYLRAHSGTFDLILSADTLCYFGPLDSFLDASHRALRAEGLLIFTVEETASGAADAGYRLQPNGRYAHERVYLKRTLLSAGFAVAAIESVVLRMEGGSPVAGLLTTCRKNR
ncbi:MAG TPA: tetratricopeptide repeat protein [Burkholderiales bacterium]